MTRVLLVAQQLRRSVPGGIGTCVRGLVHGLEQLEVSGSAETPSGDSSVVLYAGRSASRPDPLTGLGPALRSSPLPPPLLTWLWGAGLLDVPAGFDVIHAPSIDTPPARRAPLVVTVNDLAWREVPDAFPARGRRWHEAAFRRALDRAAALVAPTVAGAEALLQAGASEGTVHVIPHGCDHLPPPDDTAAAALLQRLGVTGDFILSVGTLEPRKNLGRLMSAYQRARRVMEEPLPLVVVGPTGWGPAGWPRADGHRHQPAPGSPSSVDGAGDEEGVRMAGPVPAATLAALYRRARLLAFVPLVEGYGLPPLEAMAAGTPVLSSPVPSIGEAALEVDPYDVGAIAECLARLAGDEDLRRRLSEAGASHAAALTWLESARRHRQLWESLA